MHSPVDMSVLAATPFAVAVSDGKNQGSDQPVTAPVAGSRSTTAVRERATSDSAAAQLPWWRGHAAVNITGVGGAAGAGTVLATKGKEVDFPPESKLTFVLADDLPQKSRCQVAAILVSVATSDGDGRVFNHLTQYLDGARRCRNHTLRIIT